MSHTVTRIIVAATVMLFGCASIEVAHSKSKYWIEKGTCLPTFVGPYNTGKLHKAFFATADLEKVRLDETLYACGGAVGYPTRQAAIAEAERRCKHAQAKRHTKGTCKLIDAM